MASAPVSPVQGSKMGSRLSMIIQELQKQQVKAIPVSAEPGKPRRQSRPLEVVVAVMGATGTGKSSFIRGVTGNEEVQVGDSLQSMTQKVEPFKFQHENTAFSIIDTPGFNDTYRSDNDVLKELADWLLKSYKEGIKISGIIYLHRISDPRMEGSALRNLRMFRKLCGEEFMKNVILGTTFWDVVGEGTGTAREEELLQTEGFFKDMKERGCEVVRIPADRESKLKLLSRFAAKQPMVMRIQRELFEGKPLMETAAASAISQELAELQRQNNEKLADTRFQAQRRMTKSELEMAYTRKLGSRAFEETMEDLKVHQGEARVEKEEEERAGDEKLATLRREKSRQSRSFQVRLDELDERLRTMRSNVSC